MKTFTRNLLQVLIGGLFLAGQATLTVSSAKVPDQTLQLIENQIYPDIRLNLGLGSDDSLDLGDLGLVNQPGQPPHSSFVSNPLQAAGLNGSEALVAPGDEFWDDRFNVLGVTGYVRAIAVSGSDVYVGGSFSAVGGMSANNIARWDSTSGVWSALGDGISGDVYAIAVSGHYIYAGGLFNSVGGFPSVPGTQSVARWDNLTHTWSALGSGIPGYVYALAVDGEDVYAGGLFNAAGGYPSVPGTQSIARWNANTNTWSALGSGIPGYVYTIAVSGSNVYVGGLFNAAGGYPSVPGTQSIARWDNLTHTWSALGSGIPGYVYALAVDGEDVYAGGLFNAAGGYPSIPGTQSIAHWNASSQTWSALGEGIPGYVYTIAVDGEDVYAGGLFNAVGGYPSIPGTQSIVQWNTTTGAWSALGSGIPGYVYAIAAGQDGLYTGGLFNAAGGKGSNSIGLWHGNISNPPDPMDVYWDDRFDLLGVNGIGPVAAIAVSGSSVYVGGNFSSVGDVSANNIAIWDSELGAWSALDSGVSGAVTAIAINGDDVYVGGGFSNAGGVTGTKNIARWNMTTKTWSAMGSGINGNYAYINTIAFSGQDVYVGGFFSDADRVPGTQNIARWNSTTNTWWSVGGGIGGIDTAVYAIVTSGDNVYIGGHFGRESDLHNIARWNSSTNTWFPLDHGIGNPVNVAENVKTISLSGGDIYVGGAFTSVSNTRNIAKWNIGTATWSPLGLGIDNGTVMSLVVSGTSVFAAGTFTIAGEETANRIAQWDMTGNTWSTLGSGVNGEIRAIAIGEDLYVGGYFTEAGNKPANHFTIWHDAAFTNPSGSVSGQVTGPNGSPLAGVPVQICQPNNNAACSWIGKTDSQGYYHTGRLIAGAYTLKAFPTAALAYVPASTHLPPLLGGGSLTGQDIQLHGVQTLPLGTSLTPSTTGGAGILRVDWKTPLQLATQGCAGGSASYQITQDGDVLRSGLMAEGSPGHFSASLPSFSPNYGYGTATISIQCAGLFKANEDISFTVYIDPSSIVRTTQGEPIPNATVTLYSFDPQTGAFVAVPDGDAIMSPVNRSNSDFTQSDGSFGWDTVAGFYKIRAEQAGCVAPFAPEQTFVETDILSTPSDLAGLDLRLDCGESMIFLPFIQH